MLKMLALYRRIVAALDGMRSPMLLFVRLYWGWQFTQTGWGKLHNLDRITGFFASLGIPFPALNAHFVAALEFFGGLFWIVGLATRPIALLMTGNMLVAYWTADRTALLAFFKDPGTFYAADPYTFLFAALLLLFFGPGRFAVDTLLARVIAVRCKLVDALSASHETRR